MKKLLLLFWATICFAHASAQDRMTPELLWQLGRVSGLGLSQDGKSVVYRVTTYNLSEDRSSGKFFALPLAGGTPQEVPSPKEILREIGLSPDGKSKVTVQEVKVMKITGKDLYPDLQKSNAQVYESLNYRHWDEWEDGSFNHLFVHPVVDGKPGEGKDLMKDEPHDSPQKPFGGDDDYTWSPDSKNLVYVTKKKAGTDYALSTNTDIYAYEVATGKTTNLTEGMMGYDVSPKYSSQGSLAWLSMKRDGYEADKNDIIVRTGNVTMNLTQQWDGTVNSFLWNHDGRKIFFNAPVGGTVQLFEVDYPGNTKKMPVVKQLTQGDFDINALIGLSGTTLVVSRTDMNHPAELYAVNMTNGQMQQLTHVNDGVLSKLKLSKIEKRFFPATDGKQLLSWIIYPPDFDPNKTYPTLLYCQGGPQSPLTQFYSYRWNFQLMAANGYIVVAPDRRGMQGFGVAWNEQISKDWGGQVMKDYLTAIDEMSKERFVDKSRLGCVGASYGGYSVFYLAGIHNNRFKTFIAHDGVFNLKSMYGTTEEMWFVNWDFGGPYWDKNNTAAQKTYAEFDPSGKVENWNTPILIVQGGKDYRVPDGQSFEAFQAAQLRGIKSKLLYLPDENHWVLHPQNALVWQREFFKWLKETL